MTVHCFKLATKIDCSLFQPEYNPKNRLVEPYQDTLLEIHNYPPHYHLWLVYTPTTAQTAYQHTLRKGQCCTVNEAARYNWICFVFPHSILIKASFHRSVRNTSVIPRPLLHRMSVTCSSGRFLVGSWARQEEELSL